VSVNLVANTDLRTPEEFRQLVVKEENGVVVRLGEVADVVLGSENYEEDVRFNGQAATFMGVWVLPTRTRSVIGKCGTIPRSRRSCRRNGGRHPLRLHGYIGTRRRVLGLTGTLLIVVVVLSLPWLVRSSHSRRRDSDLPSARSS
jgi:multidrug efflux pump